LVDYVSHLFRQLWHPLLCFLFSSSIWISANSRAQEETIKTWFD
jgi:hypothetical protein